MQTIEIREQKSGQSGVLYVVATPIGNLQDVTYRALEVLRQVDVIACEDTRVSKKLLNHFGIKATFISYHEHNAAEMRPKMIEKLHAGGSIALISDAGTPLISDPGYKLVREVQQAELRVIPIPGASAVMALLMAAGLPTDQFAFLGFLPNQRSHAIQLLNQWHSSPATLVCFTTPGKVVGHLDAIIEIFGECEVVIGRELTKIYEEFIRGKASELSATLNEGEKLKGEMVLAFKAFKVTSDDQQQMDKIDDLLKELLVHMPVKSAVDVVVKHSGQPKNQVYQRALIVRNGELED